VAGGSLNQEIEALRHLLRMACEWDILVENPAGEVSKLPEPKRQRYVTDDEYRAVYALASPMIQVAMDLALLTGPRRCDLTDDGALVARAKTGRAVLIRWTRPLNSIIDRAKGLPPHVCRPIIATRYGKAYDGGGLQRQPAASDAAL